MEESLAAGGRLLVHCSQGVSRSASIVIAYLMWRDGKEYEETFRRVKAVRGIANPNMARTPHACAGYIASLSGAGLELFLHVSPREAGSTW